MGLFLRERGAAGARGYANLKHRARNPSLYPLNVAGTMISASKSKEVGLASSADGEMVRTSTTSRSGNGSCEEMSETSDYQRSTPSPREDREDDILFHMKRESVEKDLGFVEDSFVVGQRPAKRGATKEVVPEDTEKKRHCSFSPKSFYKSAGRISDTFVTKKKLDLFRQHNDNQKSNANNKSHCRNLIRTTNLITAKLPPVTRANSGPNKASNKPSPLSSSSAAPLLRPPVLNLLKTTNVNKKVQKNAVSVTAFQPNPNTQKSSFLFGSKPVVKQQAPPDQDPESDDHVLYTDDDEDEDEDDTEEEAEEEEDDDEESEEEEEGGGRPGRLLTKSKCTANVSGSSEHGHKFAHDLKLIVPKGAKESTDDLKPISPTVSSSPSQEKACETKAESNNNNNSNGSSSSSSKLRFPVIQGNLNNLIQCKWKECNTSFTTYGKLSDHLKAVHVVGQIRSKQPSGHGSCSYKCLWQGCKVYEMVSCSRTWLEKHVPTHGGKFAFACIVSGCKMRFSSQHMLQRHVNQHFAPIKEKEDVKKKKNSLCQSSAMFDPYHNLIMRKKVEQTNKSESSKNLRRAGVKLKFRRSVFSARNFDFFDTGVMAGLKDAVVTQEQRATQLFGMVNDTITFTSTILGVRHVGREPEALVQWQPQNLLPTEWLPLSKVQRQKKVTFNKMGRQAKVALSQALIEPSGASGRKKHSRKWSSSGCSAAPIHAAPATGLFD